MIKFTLSNLEDIQEINRVSGNSYPYCSVYFSGREEDKLLSYCTFLLQNGEAELLDLCAVGNQDKQLLIATAKSAFNMLDLSGIHNITSKNNALKELLFDLGFQKKEENYHLNLEGYFTPCSCKGKKLSSHI